MLQLLIENRGGIQRLLVVLLFLLAMWKGNGPERACASVLLGMLAIHLGLREFGEVPANYYSLDPVGLLVDSGGLVAFVLIALQANRFYPLVLAAAQLVAFSSHVVSLLVEPVGGVAYYLLYAMPFWFQIVVLALGLGRHMYRSSFLGSYRDWRDVVPMRSTAGLP